MIPAWCILASHDGEEALANALQLLTLPCWLLPTADQAWIALTDTASNTCKSVDESDVDSWRNILVSQCSTVTPPSAGQGERQLDASTASCQAILCLHTVYTHTNSKRTPTRAKAMHLCTA